MAHKRLNTSVKRRQLFPRVAQTKNSRHAAKAWRLVLIIYVVQLLVATDESEIVLLEIVGNLFAEYASLRNRNLAQVGWSLDVFPG